MTALPPPSASRGSLVRVRALSRAVSGPRSALLLFGLAAFVMLVACNGGDNEATPVPTLAETVVSPTEAPEGTPVPTASGELSVTFTAECGGSEDAPELTVAIQATASDDSALDTVRVFVDGIQGLERDAGSAEEFDETVSLAATAGPHGVRVSAEGDGLQVVTQPEDVTCPGTPETVTPEAATPGAEER